MQQTKVVNICELCQYDGHDWETVGIIDTEIVDATRYEIVLIECLTCGQEETRLGDEIENEEEIYS